jgi:DNA (cytosine-5)-methyltransferase 1
MAYKLIDLFAGAGGMTLGFTDRSFCGGFESVLAIDNDKAAMDTHAANDFGGISKFIDIEDWVKNEKTPRSDVVVGGPPCQGFSLLNKKREGDKRRALWEPFLDVVEQSGARAFVMENVSELHRSEEFRQIQKRADDMGFDIKSDVLNTANYGVAQTRKRTIAIGWKKNALSPPVFPPPQTHADPALKLDFPRWRTVRDVIGDLPASAIGIEIGAEAPLDLHFGRSPTELSLKRYAAVPEGGNRFDLQRNARRLTPKCWIRKTSGGTDLFGRLWWDRPSVTIRTEFFKPEKGRYLHPVEDRPITHREAARIMGFPDDFEFRGSKVQIAKQIGNAVPPPFAGAIAKVIKKMLDSKARSGAREHRGPKVAAA